MRRMVLSAVPLPDVGAVADHIGFAQLIQQGEAHSVRCRVPHADGPAARRQQVVGRGDRGYAQVGVRHDGPGQTRHIGIL